MCPCVDCARILVDRGTVQVEKYGSLREMDDG
jgi:hypothetical protein